MQVITGNEKPDETEDRKQEIAVREKEKGKCGKIHGRRRKKVFWGVVLLLAAGALLVSRLGYLEDFGFWNILFSVILLGILLSGIAKRSFGQMLFSLAFLVIVNDELLNLEAITPWPVLWAALLGTVGLHILLPGAGKKRRVDHDIIYKEKKLSRGAVDEEAREGSCVSFENAFGESVRYITGEVSNVKAESNFGAMQLYFSDVILRDNKIHAHVEVSFGRAVLYVPADWSVVMNVDTAFGDASVKGDGEPDGGKVLYVDGEVSFGNLTVIKG